MSMTQTEQLLFDMARWMQRADEMIEHPVEYPSLEQMTVDELWLAEGRRLREQADRLVGFPVGVR